MSSPPRYRPIRSRRCSGWRGSGSQGDDAKAGCGASRPRDPRPKILGHIGRGARRMTRGGGRVSLRRSMQALSGLVIRQRPRLGSRAVIPSPRSSARRCARTRPCGPCSVSTHRGVRPRPSEGHAQAQRELRQRDPAAGGRVGPHSSRLMASRRKGGEDGNMARPRASLATKSASRFHLPVQVELTIGLRRIATLSIRGASGRELLHRSNQIKKWIIEVKIVERVRRLGRGRPFQENWVNLGARHILCRVLLDAV
jgi:hypothetical protein